MPMYFFYLLDDEEVVDNDGTELTDIDAAREHARQVARELMFRRDGMLQRSWSQWAMSVRDDSGQVLLSFPLGESQTTRLHDRSGPAGIKKNP